MGSEFPLNGFESHILLFLPAELVSYTNRGVGVMDSLCCHVAILFNFHGNKASLAVTMATGKSKPISLGGNRVFHAHAHLLSRE